MSEALQKLYTLLSEVRGRENKIPVRHSEDTKLGSASRGPRDDGTTTIDNPSKSAPGTPSSESTNQKSKKHRSKREKAVRFNEGVKFKIYKDPAEYEEVIKDEDSRMEEALIEDLACYIIPPMNAYEAQARRLNPNQEADDAALALRLYKLDVIEAKRKAKRLGKLRKSSRSGDVVNDSFEDFELYGNNDDISDFIDHPLAEFYPVFTSTCQLLLVTQPNGGEYVKSTWFHVCGGVDAVVAAMHEYREFIETSHELQQQKDMANPVLKQKRQSIVKKIVLKLSHKQAQDETSHGNLKTEQAESPNIVKLATNVPPVHLLDTESSPTFGKDRNNTICPSTPLLTEASYPSSDYTSEIPSPVLSSSPLSVVFHTPDSTPPTSPRKRKLEKCDETEDPYGSQGSSSPTKRRKYMPLFPSSTPAVSTETASMTSDCALFNDNEEEEEDGDDKNLSFLLPGTIAFQEHEQQLVNAVLVSVSGLWSSWQCRAIFGPKAHVLRTLKQSSNMSDIEDMIGDDIDKAKEILDSFATNELLQGVVRGSRGMLAAADGKGSGDGYRDQAMDLEWEVEWRSVWTDVLGGIREVCCGDVGSGGEGLGCGGGGGGGGWSEVK